MGSTLWPPPCGSPVPTP